MRKGILIEPFPAVGRHEEVEPGIEGSGTAGGFATRNLAVAVPVADSIAGKVHPSAQYICQERLVAVHFLAMPAVVACHDRLDASLDSGSISRGLNVAKILFARNIVTLILAAVGSPVTYKMLRGSDYMCTSQPVLRTDFALQALNQGPCIGCNHFRIFRVAFIGPSPAIIARDR